MNQEETEAMRALDARLAKLYGGLDTRPGFEERLQARIASLSAARAAAPEALRAQLEREHERARAAANRAACLDAIAVTIGGAGAAVALWKLAPQLTQWYAATLGQVDPLAAAFGSLAIVAAAGWALLRRFDVSPRTLVGA